jgi:hypothetical protein
MNIEWKKVSYAEAIVETENYFNKLIKKIEYAESVGLGNSISFDNGFILPMPLRGDTCKIITIHPDKKLTKKDLEKVKNEIIEKIKLYY